VFLEPKREMVVLKLLRLQPFRALAYCLIDADLFRHALEEHLKREYVVLEPQPSPVALEALAPASADPEHVDVPVPVVRRAATGASRG
jgi:hypothetical protein